MTAEGIQGVFTRMNDALSKLTVVGSLAFDTIQTPAGQATRVLGGSANYFSIAASFYPIPIHLVGVVGEDFPVSHLQWLSERNIDVRDVQIVPGQTFHWAGSYDQHLNEAKTVSVSLNVFEDFNPQMTAQNKNVPYLFLANIHPDLQLNVLNQVTHPSLIACDSMNHWIVNHGDSLKKLLKKVDIFFINEGEAQLLAQTPDLFEAARRIRQMGPPVLIIKRGGCGALLWTDTCVFLSPAFPTFQVKDPTGAGDSFAGAFMGLLATSHVDRNGSKTHPKEWELLLKRAVIAGCVMASFTVEDFSFQRLAQLDPKSFQERRLQMIQMTQIEPSLEPC